MIRYKIERYLMKNRCTMLGVGPMSKNCVDAAIELANELDIPMMLIASRRQIDAGQFGGGYVNNWTTEEFGRYVVDNDRKGRIILARDHGGPWQNDTEKSDGLSLRRAMASAKESFLEDIKADFQVIHIDPSVDPYGAPKVDEVLERIFELYDFCWREAQSLGKEIIFEIGTEEQSGGTNTTQDLEYVLTEMDLFCSRNRLPSPSFIVVQTGTKVMEMRNVGSFDSPLRVSNELAAEIQVPKMIELCNKFKIFMKEHNADYLSDDAIAWHPRLGIHSANVAPEFGVAESKEIMRILREERLDSLEERFVELAVESGKWKKWLTPDSSAGDFEKACISGHYIFATNEFNELKRNMDMHLQAKGLVLDDMLKSAIKQSMLRYIKGFRLVRS